jgi:hypothetical protein
MGGIKVRTNFSSHTKYANTPESDLLEEVMHIVYYMQDGVKQTVEVMAKEPTDAIKKTMNGEIDNELDRKIPPSNGNGY